MVLDLTKISLSDSVKPIEPEKIFSSLPKPEGGILYLRSVQTQVLSEWFTRRNQKDQIVKLNTGAGKTTAGLLILQSSLNEGVYPAVFATPDKNLLLQVLKEGERLKINVTQDPQNSDFQSGRSILIVNIDKIVNGKSIFGVSNEGKRINIGAIVIDDAHYCISKIENQFSIKVSNSSECYRKILALFKKNLQDQNSAGYIEIAAGDPTRTMTIPYWSWQGSMENVVKILHDHSQEFLFNWPLIRDVLALSTCYINGQGIEIIPWTMPIEAIPSLDQAKRRIFLTATFTDDTSLILNFGVDPVQISNPILPVDASDIGERMILIPQSLNPEISDDDLRSFLEKKSKDVNVVVLVSSESKSKFWKKSAHTIATKENIDQTITLLKKQHVGLVVFVNRYDGIDLPYNACRILVIHDLPVIQSIGKQIEESYFLDSENFNSRKLQKIEQGMGRGIRGNDDYCVVLLMGRQLTESIFSKDSQLKFTPATRAQIALSDKISGQLKGKTLDEIAEAMNFCLLRNDAWIKLSRESLVEITQDPAKPTDTIQMRQRNAFLFALQRRYSDSVNEYKKILSESNLDQHSQGIMIQKMAAYINFTDAAEAQVKQSAAISKNIRLIKPILGVEYRKLRYEATSQANCAFGHIKKFNSTELLVKANSITSRLVFDSDPGSFDSFEAAITEIACFLGFTSQRPEKIYDRGPDSLWAMGELNFLVIECKSESVASSVSKHDCDQLTGSMQWFSDHYDNSCKGTPILIHPSNKFGSHGTPRSDVRMINEDKLSKLCAAFLKFITAVGHDVNFPDVNKIDLALATYKLDSKSIVSTFTDEFSRKS